MADSFCNPICIFLDLLILILSWSFRKRPEFAAYRLSGTKVRMLIYWVGSILKIMSILANIGNRLFQRVK